MDKIFGVFGDLHQVKLGGGDSYTDHLSCKYTVYVLFLISILATTRVFVDEPISCYCPAQFTSSQVSFTNKVCWTTNTHYVHHNRTHLPKARDPGKKYISYYQWIPLLLAFQAVFFYIPRFVWKKLSKKCGVCVSNVVDVCVECHRKNDADHNNKIMQYMIRYMSRFLTEFHTSIHSRNAFVWCVSVLQNNYLVVVYLLVKLMYIGNVVGQLFLLNAFLGHDYHMYGLQVLHKLVSNKAWTTSHRFPRVAICDLHVRVLGNVQRHTVQCALPMNLFYEIIFIFLWFWFLFVAIASSISFLAWLLTSFLPPYQTLYIRRRLQAMEKIEEEDRTRVGRFVRDYLRMDGCFILQMAARNSNDLVVSELLAGLWHSYGQLMVKKDAPVVTGVFKVGPLGYESDVKTFGAHLPQKIVEEMDGMRKSIRRREDKNKMAANKYKLSDEKLKVADEADSLL